jgi:hypothetical protein
MIWPTRGVNAGVNGRVDGPQLFVAATTCVGEGQPVDENN